VPGLAAIFLAQLSKVNCATIESAANGLPIVRVRGSVKCDPASLRQFEPNRVLSTDKKNKKKMNGVEAIMNQRLRQITENENRDELSIASGEEHGIYRYARLRSRRERSVIRTRLGSRFLLPEPRQCRSRRCKRATNLR
jgi:hypothetical protein